jgi:hypothetical protein
MMAPLKVPVSKENSAIHSQTLIVQLYICSTVYQLTIIHFKTVFKYLLYEGATKKRKNSSSLLWGGHTYRLNSYFVIRN